MKIHQSPINSNAIHKPEIKNTNGLDSSMLFRYTPIKGSSKSINILKDIIASPTKRESAEILLIKTDIYSFLGLALETPKDSIIEKLTSVSSGIKPNLQGGLTNTGLPAFTSPYHYCYGRTAFCVSHPRNL